MQSKEEIRNLVDTMGKNGDLPSELKDKKEEYVQKLYDQQGGCGGLLTTHKHCDTCAFAEEIKPLGRQPQTRYCKIFEPPDFKPDKVIFEGGKCEYYAKED